MYLLLSKYYSKLSKKIKILIGKNFIYYFLKVIIVYSLFISLIELIWHFGVKCKEVKMG